MSELIKADNEYKEWIAGISTDFRKSQIRASMKINDEMLRFYWKLGKGIKSLKTGEISIGSCRTDTLERIIYE